MFNLIKKMFSKKKINTVTIRGNIPILVIDDTEYIAPKPKAKAWRNVIKAIERGVGSDKISSEENYLLMLKIIQITFDNEKLTIEFLDKNLYANQVTKTFVMCCEYVLRETRRIEDEFPN